MTLAHDPFESGASPPPPGRTPSQPGDLAARLEDFLAGSEVVFLETGNRLQDLGGRAARVLEGSARALEAAAASDGGGAGAAEALSREIGRMAEHIDASGRAAAEGADRLGRVVQAAAGLDGFRGAFQRIVKTLRALGICTSIESSRVNALRAGFDTVAEDIRHLSERIEVRFGAVLDRAEALRAKAREALDRAQAFGTWQRGWSAGALGDAHQNLGALEALTASATDLSRRAEDEGRRLGTVLGEVVLALQFHDIVRQRIEHVVEGLREVGRETSGGEGETALARGCRLQAAQLGRAREDLSGALEQIHGNLAQVAAGVVSLTDRAAEITGRETHGRSLLGEIERGIDEAAAALGQHAAYRSDTASSLLSVRETVGEMAASVHDIEEIGAEVELIAVNALIKSTKTGTEGRTLAVLAQEIQKLSVEARKRTAGASATLRAIAGEAEALSAAGQGGGGVDPESILAGLRSTVEGLRAFHRRLLGSVGTLRAESEALGTEVDALGGRLRSEAQEVDALAAVEADLLALAGHAAISGSGEPETGWAASAEDRYTMESERAVHRSAVGGSACSLPARAGLGDNVELF